MSRIRVLLADPNPAVLDTIGDMLQPQCEIVGTAQSGKELLKSARALNPDLVILEVGMGDITGFEALRRLQDSGCGARCIFLSLHEGVDFINTAMKMGASAYVFKSSANSDLPAAVRRAIEEGLLTKATSDAQAE